MSEITKTIVEVMGIPCLTFSSPADLTGRWKIIQVNGESDLYIECKYTVKYCNFGLFSPKDKEVIEFVSEERLYVQMVTEYPIQECCHE